MRNNVLSLYILTRTTEKIGLAVENNKIVEFVIDRPETPQLVGSIFIGKVVKVDKGLQAAFIDIGLARHAYLEQKELPFARRHANDCKIESMITEGESIIVQVIKDAYEQKGARLTANITLPSQSLVYLPFGQHIATSNKLSESQANEIKQQVQMMSENEEGAIIRTAAREMSQEVLSNLYVHLRSWWRSLVGLSKKRSVPSCLWEDHAVTERFIRTFSSQQLAAVYFEEISVLNAVRERYPSLKEKMQWDKKLVEQLPKSIEQLYQEILDPVVVLDHGITLSIEQTEAMTVIDVNSGGYSNKRAYHNTALQVNIVAAKAIASQLRLRNVSGIIVVDFIRMKNKAEQNKVLQVLKTHLQKDRIRSTVHGFTKLGLLEMTRKREAPTHRGLVIDSTKPTSKGILSIRSQFYQLERLLISFQQTKVESVIIDVNPTLYRFWMENWNRDVFGDSFHPTVYFVRNKGVANFTVKLTGSDELIADYLVENTKQPIDKVL